MKPLKENSGILSSKILTFYLIITKSELAHNFLILFKNILI